MYLLLNRMICKLKAAIPTAVIFKSNLNVKYAFIVIHLLRHSASVDAFWVIFYIRNTANAEAVFWKVRLGIFEVRLHLNHCLELSSNFTAESEGYFSILNNTDYNLKLFIHKKFLLLCLVLNRWNSLYYFQIP